jgi:hypothetical protein
MYKVISFGHRCSSASFIKLLDLKTESYPFDWIVSKLDVVQNCIETNFVNFLNVNNYVAKNTETYNMIDNTKRHICNENIQVNVFYETNNNNNSDNNNTDNTDNNNNISTYNYKLALTHHNLNNVTDYEYYQRCIVRLYELFEMDIRKYYIYFHPIVGINEYQHTKEHILNEFDNFNQFITTKTTNIFGIYFILINHSEHVKSIKIKETPHYTVFILFCNANFLDGGGTFSGNYRSEESEVLHILKNIFI